jgi:photosystem II stability/assembly factor-like uncharacterized protein
MECNQSSQKPKPASNLRGLQILAQSRILTVAVILYWASSRHPSSEQTIEAQKQTQSATTNPSAPSEPARGEHQCGPAPKLETRKSSTPAESPSVRGQEGIQSGTTKTEATKAANLAAENAAPKVNPPNVNYVRPLHVSGWAVGDSGTILHTEDGGASWKPQYSGTSDHLHSVAFATPESGWAVGDSGTILHTSNGGGVWEAQRSGSDQALYFVPFATPQSGWAVGVKGTILHTDDGGRTWNPQSSGTSALLLSVAFATQQSAWAVGIKGTILHTEDGGRTWSPQNSGTNDQLHSVAFATSESGWAVGYGGIILHTEDGGRTWNLQSSGTIAWLNSVTLATPR